MPITDLAVKNGDLVVATQGRSFWILDDLTSLRQWNDAIADSAVSPLSAASVRPDADREPGRGRTGARQAAGKNVPNGVIVDYWLKDKPGEKTRRSPSKFSRTAKSSGVLETTKKKEPRRR